jgi:putative tryptophan/tyrosine transport system substrate-binding protein
MRRRAARWSSVGLLAVLVMATMWPSAGSAQTAHRAKRIGILASVSCPGPDLVPAGVALIRRLAELGWVDGQTATFDCISAAGRIDQAPALAAELVARRPDVLFGSSTPVIRALKSATRTIPIVSAASDPLQSGLVSNLAHPEANVTGVSTISFDLVAKRMEFLKETLPGLSRLAFITRKGADLLDLHRMGDEITKAANVFGYTWEVFYLGVPEEIDAAFARLASEGYDAAYISPGPFTYLHRVRIGDMARQHRVPTVADATEYAKAGALLSYGVDGVKLLTQAAEYIDKILRGKKPADLPVEQPTKYELAINLKTAKALGLTVPPSLHARADEVIE